MRIFAEQSSTGSLTLKEYNMLLSLVVTQYESCSRIIADMREKGVPSHETTISLEVRSLLHAGKLNEAEDRLSLAETSGITLKQRSYAGLFKELCERHQITAAESVRARMTRIGCLKEMDFVEYIKMVVAIGDEMQMEAALRELQTGFAQIEPATLHALQAALQSAPVYTTQLGTCGPDGVCSCCGMRLQALALTDTQRDELCSELLKIAGTLSPDLKEFGDWLQGKDSVYIIDGANVGYRNQNFEGAGFSYQQIDIARRSLRDRQGGVEPILVLPERYLKSEIPNHSRYGSEELEPVLAEEARYKQDWQSTGVMWVCPDDTNDDWYWMYAAAIIGPAARVLSNDEMCDHAVQLSALPYFVRWKKRHMVHFNFSHASARDRSEPVLELKDPLPYSPEIQCSQNCWHFPSRPCAAELLCVEWAGDRQVKHRRLGKNINETLAPVCVSSVPSRDGVIVVKSSVADY